MNVLTKETSGESWLHERSSRICASDVAAILGIEGAFSTALQVWARITGKVGEPDITEEQARAFEYGRRLEPVAAEWWQDVTELQLEHPPGMLVHPEHDWLCGTPDRLIMRSGAVDEGVWEGKTANRFRASLWEHSIPLPYVMQLQVYLILTGRSWGSFGCIVNQGLVQRSIEADPALHDAILGQLDDFWEKNVLRDIPPETTRRDVRFIQMLHPDDNGRRVILGDSFVELAERFDELTRTKKETTQELDALKAKVKLQLGDNTFGDLGGEGFSWKAMNRAGKAVRVLRRTANIPENAPIAGDH